MSVFRRGWHRLHLSSWRSSRSTWKRGGCIHQVQIKSETVLCILYSLTINRSLPLCASGTLMVISLHGYLTPSMALGHSKMMLWALTHFAGGRNLHLWHCSVQNCQPECMVWLRSMRVFFIIQNAFRSWKLFQSIGLGL